MRAWEKGNLIAAALSAVVQAPALGQCDSWQALGRETGAWTTELIVYNGDLIAGGSGLDRWNGSAWVPFEGGGGVNGLVYALAVYKGELIAGGWFTSAGGQPVNFIAAWDGESWHAVGGGMNSVVLDLAVHDGELIASGEFTYAGGTQVDHIARWNGVSWQPMGNWNNDYLYGFTIYEGQLYGGGLFDVVRWNGSAWETFGADSFGGQVGPVAVYNGELIIAGSFTTMNGQSVNRIARWNGTVAQPLGEGISGGVAPQVRSLVVYNGELIVGGDFTTAGLGKASCVARWNGASWSPLGVGVDDDNGVPAVAATTVYGDELIIAGGFDTAGDVAANSIARWQDCDLCLADLTDDQEVNIDDLFDVIGQWGPCPGPPPPSCPADITGNDDMVDVADLFSMIFALNFGISCPEPPYDCPVDINFDGLINIDDLFDLLAAWGPCPPPPPPQPLCPADLAPTDTGGDGIVDIDDLFLIIDAWGPCG